MVSCSTVACRLAFTHPRSQRSPRTSMASGVAQFQNGYSQSYHSPTHDTPLPQRHTDGRLTGATDGCEPSFIPLRGNPDNLIWIWSENNPDGSRNGTRVLYSYEHWQHLVLRRRHKYEITPIQSIRREVWTGETGDPQENSLASGIVRHDSHMRKSGRDPAENRTRFALMGSFHTGSLAWGMRRLSEHIQAENPTGVYRLPEKRVDGLINDASLWSTWPRQLVPRDICESDGTECVNKKKRRGRGPREGKKRYDGNSARLASRSDETLGVRVSAARIAPSLLDLGRGVPKEPARPPPRRSELNPRPGHSGFSQMRIVPDDAVGRRVFSGIFRVPRPLSPALLHTYLSHPQDLDIKSGMDPVGTPRPRSRSEGAIRATLTRTPSASSLIRARRTAFPYCAKTAEGEVFPSHRRFSGKKCGGIFSQGNGWEDYRSCFTKLWRLDGDTNMCPKIAHLCFTHSGDAALDVRASVALKTTTHPLKRDVGGEGKQRAGLSTTRTFAERAPLQGKINTSVDGR
ncbi:hypothetical protein PR048_021940 [Dryococelus australis]|uniref:Uncharacterized protein n=1 Tax=Dryococelus australis TaxID=614101 RepID=A0ABQ9GZL6_9NEOP|nr:hypothetical protein PR048_021940 [Dryococelus australis]